MSASLIPWSPLFRLTLGGALLVSACTPLQDTAAPVIFREPTAERPAVVAAAPAPAPVTPVAPQADARGIIDRGSYQAIAPTSPDDNLIDMATRVGLSPAELANYNGVPVTYEPDQNEELVLPPRPDRYAGTRPGGWTPDIAAAAIERSNLPGLGAEPAPAVQPAGQAQPLVHVVEPGETLFSIARQYDIPVTSIADWNGLGADFALSAGQRIEIPFGMVTPAAAPTTPPTATIAADPLPGTTTTATSDPIPGLADVVPGVGATLTPPPSSAEPLPEDTTLDVATPEGPDLGQFQTPAPASSAAFIPPVSGPVLRPFSASGSAVDKGMEFGAPAGTPVVASADGEVRLVSRSIGDLDTIVMIGHPDGITTVYGRLTGVTVSANDRVRQGQQIGVVASRDEPSVQFQVRRGMNPTDPADFF
ncbi:M23 family metallopeptidase [Roseobacter sp. HKCCA0434]|uniref:M23 family metallopeptidase n=1 Tax=Roseobacter sp. HKCCA0434 TaxID=3079297 RepID=UPI0029058DF4|nr:M23 family metallopeptidase [Roseobacter sp. HKCCA0434]